MMMKSLLLSFRLLTIVLALVFDVCQSSSLSLSPSNAAIQDNSSVIPGNDDDENVFGRGEPLKVVYAAFGRTGSHSMSAALTKLGFKTCHGMEVCPDVLGSHADMANAIVSRNVSQLLDITSSMGYNATLELHGFFWRDIWNIVMQQEKDGKDDVGGDESETQDSIHYRQDWNNVKFIFVVRRFDEWYPSFVETLKASKPMMRYPLKLIPVEDKIGQILAAGVANSFDITLEESQQLFLNPTSEKTKDILLREHVRYRREVSQLARAYPNRTLLFDLETTKFQYDILCEFLNISTTNCPKRDETFPHLNCRKDIIFYQYISHGLELIMYLVAVIPILGMKRFVRWFVGCFVVISYDDKRKTKTTKKD